MRLHQWPRLMAEAIEEAKTKTFKWGEFDCMLFAADVVKAITGVDYAEPFRGTYDSEQGAYEIIDIYGSEVELLNIVLDNQPVDASQAMRGDVVLALLQRPLTGICMGNLCAYPSEKGIRFLPRSTIVHAWRIA